MRAYATRSLLVISLILLLTAQVLASSGGPPDLNMSGESTVLNGCNCHGSAAPSAPSGPSTDVVVSISGVPSAYQVDTAYNLTIKVEHSSNTAGGFLLSSNSVGTFSWEDGVDVRPAEGNEDPESSSSTSGNISHSETADPAEWTITWTAPSSDIGDVTFYLAGNSVDGHGSNDDSDAWNLLSFTINSPSSTSAQADLATRVISVGDYQSLFVSEPDPAALEQEKQLQLAESVFTTGNTLFFSSLCVLLVAAVFQREILERTTGEGPQHLAKDLAYPEGLKRGLISGVMFLVGLNWLATGAPAYLYAPAIFCGFWAAYGVYRTVRSARAEPVVKDIL